MKIEGNMLDKYFEERREFSRFEVAVYVLAEAKKNGGIYCLSISATANHVGWHKQKLTRFFAEMEADGVIKKTDAGWKVIVVKELTRIEVESVGEPEYIIPTLVHQPEQQPIGVPPTKAQLKTPNPEPQTFIDMKAVNWEIGITVPKLRLYKRYLEKNEAYIMQADDERALEILVKNIENQLRAFNTKKGNPTTKAQLLTAVDNFVDNVFATFYRGFPLIHLANEYNKVTAAILKAKQKDNQTV